MTITITQAIARVRFLIDDKDANPLISDAEILVALETAYQEVWQLAIVSGANIYNQQVNLTSDGNGVLDLSAFKPMKIVNVALKLGNVFLQVKPCRLGDGLINVPGPQTFRVTYVPRVVLPAAGVDPIEWPIDIILDPVLDQLLCVVAAADVWIKTGQPTLPSLAEKRGQLEASVKAKINIPGWSVTTLGRRGGLGQTNAGFYWQQSAYDSIQFVY